LNEVPDKVVGIILAGGLGRRLGGGGKAQLLLAGRPLLAHVIERMALQLAPGQLRLNANGDPAELAEFGLPIVPDTIAGRPGPLAGVLAGMQTKAAWVLTVPTDTPFLPLDLLAALIARQAETGAEIVLAASDAGLCQVCGLWSADLAAALAQSLASGQNKVLDFATRHGAVQAHFPLQQIGHATVDPFFNINTPDDLASAERILSA
jgi:molybdenum cofactor guanylyltransferase